MVLEGTNARILPATESVCFHTRKLILQVAKLNPESKSDSGQAQSKERQHEFWLCAKTVVNNTSEPNHTTQWRDFFISRCGGDCASWFDDLPKCRTTGTNMHQSIIFKNNKDSKSNLICLIYLHICKFYVYFSH